MEKRKGTHEQYSDCHISRAKNIIEPTTAKNCCHPFPRSHMHSSCFVHLFMCFCIYSFIRCFLFCCCCCFLVLTSCYVYSFIHLISYRLCIGVFLFCFGFFLHVTLFFLFFFCFALFYFVVVVVFIHVSNMWIDVISSVHLCIRTENFGVEHYAQTLRSNSIIPAKLIGTI